MKILQLIVVAFMTIALSACGSKLNGTYSTGNGMTKVSYTFNSNGKVQQESFAGKVEYDYELNGKDIKIGSIGMTGPAAILTLIDANTIGGPMGMKLVKEN